MQRKDDLYIRRCLDLALLGRGQAAPNPLVGAIIVHEDRIIGEGYHMKYGTAHAEVNAIASIKEADRHLLEASRIYVSLEPCCIHGNTPPCTALIIKHKIPEVVFCCIDQTAGVKGKSIELLEAAGCKVTYGILKKKGERIIESRTVFTTQARPYILLKYAQSQDGFLGKAGESIWLTNPISKRLVHKWRAENQAILVGTNTALTDDPQLNNRLYFGSTPLRIVLDRNLTLKPQLKLLDQAFPTWVITAKKAPPRLANLRYIQLPFDDTLLARLLALLHEEKYGTLIVEGGQQTLESFIREGLWDEARIFETKHRLEDGLKAPDLESFLVETHQIMDDQLKVYLNKVS